MPADADLGFKESGKTMNNFLSINFYAATILKHSSAQV